MERINGFNAESVSESLEKLQVSTDPQPPTQHQNSQATSATTSIPPSTTLSVASYDTPDTSSDEDEPPPAFEVRQTKDRGLALFSTRRIPAGSLIFSEPALVSVPESLENDYSAIEDAFSSISKSSRKAYLALFNAEKSRMSKVVSIYYSNCYNLSPSRPEGGSCISPLASRINHSCIPNACFSYIPPSPSHPSSEGEVRFHALKDIAKGKEILACYEKNIFLSRAQRQRRLVLDYGFKCDCEACTPKSEFWERSDERRAAMGKLVKAGKEAEKHWEEIVDREQVGDQKGKVIEVAMETLVKLETLLLKERLTYSPLANVYRSLAKWSHRAGQDDEVRKWKEKELKVCARCFGERVERCITLRKELESTH